MMYIEPSHLDRKRHILLRHHTNSSVEEILLAHVQEAAQAAPRLQLETNDTQANNLSESTDTHCRRVGEQTNICSDADEKQHQDYNAGVQNQNPNSQTDKECVNLLNINNQSGTTVFGQPTVVAQCESNQEEDIEIAFQENRGEEEVVKNHEGILTSDENNEEQYELIDVDFDLSDQLLEKSGTEETIVVTANSQLDLDTSSTVYTLLIDQEQDPESDTIEIILQQTVQQNFSQTNLKQPPPLKQIYPTNTDSSRGRFLRPVPDAIPIELFHEVQERSHIKRNTLREVGFEENIWIPSNCEQQEEQQQDEWEELNNVEEQGICENGENAVHDEETAAEDDCPVAHEEADFDLVTQPLESGISSSMGLLNKLRQLLNFTIQGHDPNANQENRHKRKLRNRGIIASGGPQPFKYQKVDHSFPDIAVSSWEDDAHLMYAPYMQRQENCSTNCQQQQSNRYNLQSKCRGIFPQYRSAQLNNGMKMSTSKSRRSIFVPPEQEHRIVRNTAQTTIEYELTDDEDDDSCCIIEPSDITQRNRLPDNTDIILHNHNNLNTNRGTTTTINLNAPRGGHASNQHFRTNGQPIELSLSGQRQSTYEDMLKAGSSRHIFNNGGQSGGGRTDRQSNIITCSSGSSSCTSGKYGDFGQLINNHHSWRENANANSILLQQKESMDREKYQQLLEQVMPRVYGGTTNSSISINSLRRLEYHQKGSAATASTSAAAGVLTTTSAGRRGIHEKENEISPNAYQHLLKTPSFIDLKCGDRATGNNGTSADTATFSNVIKMDIDDEIPLNNDVTEIIDLDDSDDDIQKQKQTVSRLKKSDKALQVSKNTLPYVAPVNSLLERFTKSPLMKENWLTNWQSQWNTKRQVQSQQLAEMVKFAEKMTNQRIEAELDIHERLRKFQIVDPELVVIDDFSEASVEEEEEILELNVEQQDRLKSVMCGGGADQVLISKFNLNITRRDIHTLVGRNWLNDEVINFYMSLLTERGERKAESHDMPRVYAMNTFFVQRLLATGYSGVKRWTRKVNIFSKDILPVPVHVGGVHWCMAIIHLQNRTIKYYDSMGTPNPTVLKALEQYLKDESMDKLKQPFDTSDFVIESVRDVPRQMNGSDCGVFSCMFAEYITRNRDITFSQENMDFFRQKMILEIIKGELFQ